MENEIENAGTISAANLVELISGLGVTNTGIIEGDNGVLIGNIDVDGTTINTAEFIQGRQRSGCFGKRQCGHFG